MVFVINLILIQHYEINTIILQMKKLSYKKDKLPAQALLAEWRDLDLGSLMQK